jgi:hypothetical protein
MTNIGHAVTLPLLSQMCLGSELNGFLHQSEAPDGLIIGKKERKMRNQLTFDQGSLPPAEFLRIHDLSVIQIQVIVPAVRTARRIVSSVQGTVLTEDVVICPESFYRSAVIETLLIAESRMTDGTVGIAFIFFKLFHAFVLSVSQIRQILRYIGPDVDPVLAVIL